VLSGVILYAAKVKIGVFLLAGARKGIRHTKLRIPKPLVKKIKGAAGYPKFAWENGRKNDMCCLGQH